jgi:hypothetical protein
MPLNGTELIEHPIDTIMSPYTGLIGSWFWLIPISIIAAALYRKTKSITAVGAWLMGAGAFMSGTDWAFGMVQFIDFYIALIVIGFITVIIGIVFPQDR